MRLNDAERRMARGIHGKPSADGRYWDLVAAALADRDDLLDAAREVVEEMGGWVILPHSFERLRDLATEPGCAECGHPESQHDCCPLRCSGCGEGFVYHSYREVSR